MLTAVFIQLHISSTIYCSGHLLQLQKVQLDKSEQNQDGCSWLTAPASCCVNVGINLGNVV